MAIMFSGRVDWSFDMFMEDVNRYEGRRRGIHCSSKASDREQFMTWLKTEANEFKAKWLKDHNGRLYDRYDGWAGDRFAMNLCKGFFSDFYKDVYCQRPHLPIWYYVHSVNLPMSEDTARTFCAYPIEEAVDEAKRNREWLIEMSGE